MIFEIRLVKLLAVILTLSVANFIWHSCSIPTYVYAFNDGDKSVRIKLYPPTYDSSETYTLYTSAYDPDHRTKSQDVEKYRDSTVVVRSGDSFEIVVGPGRLAFLAAGSNNRTEFVRGSIHRERGDDVPMFSEEMMQLNLEDLVFSGDAGRYVFLVDLVETLERKSREETP